MTALRETIIDRLASHYQAEFGYDRDDALDRARRSPFILNAVESLAEERKALQRIASYSLGGIILEGTPEADRHNMVLIAREALREADVAGKRPPREVAYDILQKHLSKEGYGGSVSQTGYFARRDRLTVEAMLEFSEMMK